jgi:hypothetical protein
MKLYRYAGVAKLVDAQVSEACSGNTVLVQIQSPAPTYAYAGIASKQELSYGWHGQLSTPLPKTPNYLVALAAQSHLYKIRTIR